MIEYNTPLLIASPEEMVQLGKEMAKHATHILLYGDLGAGKTHFVKGYMEGLDMDSYKVQSPTYTYFHDYDSKVLHMDMYRLDDRQYFINKGMLQQMDNFDYVLVERPKYEDLYATGYTKIYIAKKSPTERLVKIEK